VTVRYKNQRADTPYLSCLIRSGLLSGCAIHKLHAALGQGQKGENSRRVLASALLFGSLHLSLLLMGTDALTVVIIVTAATLLGLAAAKYRERHQSVLPSVVTHIGFNVGGFVAGLMINVVSMVVTGHLIKK
jgi:ABC-type dipeptide/oligopeptide/nickel transport system permease component